VVLNLIDPAMIEMLAPASSTQLVRYTNRLQCKQMIPRVGDIFQIPLPDGRFAYGKVFRDASVGIYETFSMRLLTYLSNRHSHLSLGFMMTY